MAKASSPINTSIPCLPYVPFLGNILALRNRQLELLLSISQRFGDIGAFHSGPHMVPVLNSPEFIRQVLVEQEANFLSEGEEHRKQSSLLASLFHHRQILNYADIMVTCTSSLQKTWNEGEMIDLAGEMKRLTLWIISKVLFDKDVVKEAKEPGDVLTYTFRHFADAVTNPLRLPQSWPTPRNKRAQQALERMIEERQQSSVDHNDVLSMLLQVQDEAQVPSLSDRQMRDEVLSLFVPGYETTANALTWCWYLLSQHPVIYAKMQAEVDYVLAGRLPTAADLPNLPYTLQVFKETLRLYPPVYAFTRRVISPVQLGRYHIPAETSVVISPYALHRRSSLFPEPTHFDPERFTPQKEQSLPQYAYLPFGAGSHICPGMHFALLEGHLLLATLAQCLTFEFAGTGPIKPEPLLTLRPKGTVLMRVQRV